MKYLVENIQGLLEYGSLLHHLRVGLSEVVLSSTPVTMKRTFTEEKFT